MFRARNVLPSDSAAGIGGIRPIWNPYGMRMECIWVENGPSADPGSARRPAGPRAAPRRVRRWPVQRCTAPQRRRYRSIGKSAAEVLAGRLGSTSSIGSCRAPPPAKSSTRQFCLAGAKPGAAACHLHVERTPICCARWSASRPGVGDGRPNRRGLGREGSRGSGSAQRLQV